MFICTADIAQHVGGSLRYGARGGGGVGVAGFGVDLDLHRMVVHPVRVVDIKVPSLAPPPDIKNGVFSMICRFTRSKLELS